MKENYLSVAQVNNYIKNIFEAESLLQNIAVFGEISSYNISNGIAYFNIKDENNLLSCVMFGAARFDAPSIGDMVLVTGSVSFYAKGGRLTFRATKIAPYGKGLLYEKFLELKARLEKQGYFDKGYKKSIPKRVKRIGVVTSATGAVLQDIRDVTHRRNIGTDIVLYSAKVQGIGAEVEIANGINFFSQYDGVDCVIVARGGGSIEDLQPFNTLEIAEATYNCLKPIVSAVGHETDFTIIDFVSDLRAPTPSAAAELVVNKRSDDITFIFNSIDAIEKSLLNTNKHIAYEVGKYTDKLNYIMQTNISNAETYVSDKVNKLQVAVDNAMVKMYNDISNQYSIIQKLNPKKLLLSGFTKVESKGKNISSIKDIENDQLLNFYLVDGKVDSQVVNIVKENI